MTRTGWITGDEQAPALPQAAMLLGMAGHRAGALETALARSRAAEARQVRDEAAGARDPDEAAANMVSRGYVPGLVSDLVLRRRDKEAELEGERAKLERGERVAARVRGMLERGQVGGLEASRMLDGDFGDAQRAALLERQIARMDAQVADAQAMIAPAQQRDADPLEAASRQANQVFRELTRAKMAEAEQGRTAPRWRAAPFRLRLPGRPRRPQ